MMSQTRNHFAALMLAAGVVGLAAAADPYGDRTVALLKS